MPVKVNRIVEIPNIELGEGPHWDARTQSLYFVDIFGKAIHKYVPSTRKHTKAILGTNHVSLIIPVDGTDDKFLISLGRELVVVTWDGTSDKVSKIEKICEVDNEPERLDNRFNDGKCDPNGKLWAGTMGAEPIYGHVKPNNGGFFSLETGGKVKKHVDNVGISNGLAWDSTGTRFYYIDTPKGVIEQYDYDSDKSVISNPKIIFTIAKHGLQGVLDGMTIDTDGNLWIALFNGYKVIKINPNKPETLLESIDIPAKQTTSVTFGGENLDEIYVTSAAFTVDGAVLPPPDHGATYVITGTGAKGYPGVNVKL